MIRRITRLPEWPLALAVVTVLAGPFLFARLYNSDVFSDEPIYFEAGKEYVRNILEGNFRAEDYSANLEHPAIAKYLFGLAALVGGPKDYLSEEIYPAKVLSGCVAILTGLVVFLAGRDLFGRRVGWLAACVCVLMPQVLAHGRVAGLDGLTLFFYTLATWLFYRGIRADLGGRAENKYYLLTTLATTVAISTRLNSALLVPHLLGVYGAVKLYLLVKRRELRLSHFLHMILWLPPLFFIVHFPWFWQNTFDHLAQTFGHWGYKPREWYMGRWQYPDSRLYYLQYFLGTTALPGLLMPALLPILWLLHRLLIDRKPAVQAGGSQTARGNGWKVLFVLVWLAAPFGWSFSYFRQDGVRYILQIYAPLSILTALSVVLLENLLHRWREILPKGVVSGALVVALAVQAVVYFPYYLDYFNLLVLGPKGVFASRVFEMSWWGEGSAAAIRQINDERVCPRGARVRFDTGMGQIWRYYFVRRDLVVDRQTETKTPDFLVRSGWWVYPIKEHGKQMLCPGGYESIWEERHLGVPLFRLCRRTGGLSPPHQPAKLLRPLSVDDSLYVGVCMVDDYVDRIWVDGREIKPHLTASLYEKQSCQVVQFVCRIEPDSELVFACRDIGGSGSLSAAFLQVKTGRWYQVLDPADWQASEGKQVSRTTYWRRAVRRRSFAPLRRMALEELQEVPSPAFRTSVWGRWNLPNVLMKLTWPVEPEPIK